VDAALLYGRFQVGNYIMDGIKFGFNDINSGVVSGCRSAVQNIISSVLLKQNQLNVDTQHRSPCYPT